MKSLAIYIHYPFCKSKCPYCDFNSHVKDQIDHQRFLTAYLQELDFFFQKCGIREVTSIFFGGGTPSLMPITLVEKILEKIQQLWSISPNCEITLETNPTSFEAAKFKDLRHAGINRISVGIQALNDADLKFLGRQHSAKEAIDVIATTQKIFDNFSFDLIYARPQQKLSDWQKELQQAISFGSKHLSLYQLTIEKGTKFFSQYNKKEFSLPNEELAAALYESTYEITKEHGLELYEISNYAKTNYQSQHNLAYWLGHDYIGIGAGAHSRVYFKDSKKRQAIMMIHEPTSWLSKVEQTGCGIQQQEEILPAILLEELIMMGLRLRNGISDATFLPHFNKKISEIFDFKKLQELEQLSLISLQDNKIAILEDKFLLTNSIIEKISHFTQIKLFDN